MFAPGESAKTVRVAVHDDEVDEGEETMTLTFSNPRGAAWLPDAVATGTIRNSDAIPNPQTPGEVLCIRLARRHGAHRHLQHGAVHLARPTALVAPRPRRRQARADPLGDELALELRQRREDSEHQTSVRGGGTDLGARAGEHSKAHAALGQLVHGADQVFQITPQSVELPHHERVARLQRLQAGVEARAVIVASGGAVFVDALRGDAGVEKRVALQVQELAPIGL